MRARIRRQGRVTAIAMLGLSLAIFEANSPALAQSGSAGGSVGPSEKTISGERSAMEPAAPAPHHPAPARRTEPEHRAPAAAPKEAAAGNSRCHMLLGSWSFSNGVGVMFKPGGGLSSTTGDGGTWSCDNGMIAAHRPHWTDHYLVSSDGAHITGNSGLLNFGLTATKN
jgi:hypothetical protein